MLKVSLGASMSISRVKSLNAIIMQARYAYYVQSSPVMEDAAYDALEKELKALVATDPGTLTKFAPVLTAVGSDLASPLGTVKHKEPMLSLDNAYTQADVEKWCENHPPETTYVIEPKVDGLSLSCRYADHKLWLAVTRGDGAQGDDVTAAALTILDIPKTIPTFLPQDLEIRGEVFITKSQFDRLNEELEARGEAPYKNQRNLASGSLKLKDVREVAKRGLSFMPWQVLGLEPPAGRSTPDVNNPNLTLAQQVEAPGHVGLEHTQALEYVHAICRTRQPQSWRVYNRDELWAVVEKHRLLRDTLWTDGLGMCTDGIVIKVEEHATRKLLGVGSKDVKWGIAFKYPADRVNTKLLDVSWQVGRTGRLTPVAELEPVSVSGSTISRANLNNISFIQSELGDPKINDTLIIYKGGDVIPQVQGVAVRSVNPLPIVAPIICPSCGKVVSIETTADTVNKAGEVTKRGGISHFCTNTSCPGRMIAHFCYIGKREVMDIEGLGDVLAEQFVTLDIAPSMGYLWVWGQEAKKLMADDRDAFEENCAEAGFSVAQIRTLVDSLDRARTAGWDKWLQGLGIPGIAKETSKALASHLALGSEDLPKLLDKLLTIKPGDCEGIGPITVRDMHGWALDPVNAMDIRLLQDSGVKPSSTALLSDGPQPLMGYVLCITGEFGEDRVILQQKLTALGAICKAGVSKKTNLLLIGTDPGRNKTSRAAELGIRTEGKEWLLQALKSGGLGIKDNGMPVDDDLEDI